MYQKAGVAEYRIVDSANRVIERWRPDDDRPEVCDAVLEWHLDEGSAATLDLHELY